MKEGGDYGIEMQGVRVWVEVNKKYFFLDQLGREYRFSGERGKETIKEGVEEGGGLDQKFRNFHAGEAGRIRRGACEGELGRE